MYAGSEQVSRREKGRRKKKRSGYCGPLGRSSPRSLSYSIMTIS